MPIEPAPAVIRSMPNVCRLTRVTFSYSSMGWAPTLIHVKAISRNERKKIQHGRRHHGSQHIAVRVSLIWAGHRDGMRLRAVQVVSLPRLAASSLRTCKHFSFGASALSTVRFDALTVAGLADSRGDRLGNGRTINGDGLSHRIRSCCIAVRYSDCSVSVNGVGDSNRSQRSKGLI
jgi:hypothetical protein